MASTIFGADFRVTIEASKEEILIHPDLLIKILNSADRMILVKKNGDMVIPFVPDSEEVVNE